MSVRRADDSLRGPTGERESCSDDDARAEGEAPPPPPSSSARTSASSERDSFLSRPASLHE
jgi:hypothetical protein